MGKMKTDTLVAHLSRLRACDCAAECAVVLDEDEDQS